VVVSALVMEPKCFSESLPSSKTRIIQVGSRNINLPNISKLFPPGRIAGFGALALFAFLRFWDPAPLEITRNYFFDLYQKAHPRAVLTYPVTIVDIDDKSLAVLGQWPWPRLVLAKLVNRLSEGGAAVIGFDMTFPESDRLSPRRLAALVQTSDEDLKRRLAAMPDNDELFAEAIKGRPVVLGCSSQWGTISDREPKAKETLPKVSVATIGGDPRAYLLHISAPLRNLPGLDAAAAGRGMLTVRPERDGVIRRAPLLLWAGSLLEPGMAIELLRVASGASSLIVKRDEAGVKSIALTGVEIPTDADGQLWVSFTPHDARRYVSAVAVLAGEVPPERIEGKIAIIGTSAAGLFDLKSTPLDRVLPGVEIQAQIVESILSGTTLNRPNFALGLEVALAVAIGAVLVILAPLAGALVNLLIGGAIALLLAAGAWYLFVAQKLLIDVSYPLASSFAIFLLMTFMNYIREEKRRTWVRAAFRQYLSPVLVEQLIREPGRLVLGGETREMSILFSDVRGFTSIAESFKSNPAGLTALMNRMLTSLSHPIIERRGTIDKYIGDAIMAFWNAPLDEPNHALNACEAALDILRRLDDLNEERRTEALRAGTTASDMVIGIGISTGISVVGNMGSDLRFDYSVLGDCVNLASRLEALTADYGLPILLGSETARCCSVELAIIEVDRVRVKGKQDAETIFTLLGGRELAQQDEFKSFQTAFLSLLSCYREKDWPLALLHLDRCRNIDRMGQFRKLLDLYSSRIANFAENPPPADWDGVFKAWAAAV
jgi:adenylate cyclase